MWLGLSMLKPHQQKFIDENPRKAILNWETRAGKSLPATIWVDMPERSGNTYIICLKQNKKEWQSYKTKATVMTKEEFKKAVQENRIIKPTAIVVDEIHYFASPLFLRTRSQLAECLYKIVKDNPDMDILGLSGTIIRQDAWSLHTLLCYIGVYYDWKKWREMFFEMKSMPFLRFPAWFPKKNWRDEIKPFKEKHCNILGLKDIVEYLPPIKDEVVNIKNKIPKQERWTDEHKLEQKGKIEYISQLGYNKIIVVAHYTEQIDELAKELSKYKNVYILDGRTKDADATKKLAQADEECFFIVQSSMGFGFDGYMFGALVFASMSHSCVHHTQMIGRLRNLNHLRPLTHIYLLGGVWDNRIYKTVKSGQDFNPNNYVA
jgi:superfamily II DNA or RNA helicase